MVSGDGDVRVREHIYGGVDEGRDQRRHLFQVPPVFYG